MGGKPEPIGYLRGRPIWPIMGGSTGEETPPSGGGGTGDLVPESVAPGGKTAEAWRAEARKWEERAKRNLEEKKALQAIADTDKSELQKLNERFDEAEKRAAAADLRALRADVANAKKLSPAQANRLVGTTKEELETDADAMIADFGIKPGEGGGGTGDGKPPLRPPGSKPEENLSGGSNADGEVIEMDPRKLAKAIEGAD
jgi:Domain of unknown function (DUF4355)